jgi:dephospho-CoA kinase
LKLKYKIGITGGIGSGKSYICSILEKMGYPVFYADKVSKSILASDPIIISKIKSLLGEQAYHLDGSVNTAYIANQIFNDDEKLATVNGIMHPAVRLAFDSFAKLQNNALVFNEAAIIFEAGGHEKFDKTILVIAPKAVKIKRILTRDAISESEIESRMAKQWSDDQKIPLADYIIKNGDNDMLLPQINEILVDILPNREP